MEFTTLLETRRSYRSYAKTPVPHKLFTEIITAANKSPVSCNLQLTQYVIVDDPELLQTLTKEVSYKFGYAPACIIVLYDPRFTVEHHSAVMTAGMAVENLLLRATELGLATCPMAGFRKDARIKELLNIPTYLELLLLIPIGYPVTPPPRPIPKLPLESTFAFNNYKGLEQALLKDTQELGTWTPNDVRKYRSRIAPVYLERFSLRIYDESYYKKAAEVFGLILKKSGAQKVLDLMSYDGMFLKFLIETHPFATVTASDYVDNNLTFFKEALGVQTVTITSDNEIPSDEQFDAISFIFQLQFTPQLEVLFRNALAHLAPGGSFFVAVVQETWYRRAAKKMRSLRHSLSRKLNNVYEGNPFYRLGPFTQVSRSRIRELVEYENCTLMEEYTFLPKSGVRLDLYHYKRKQ